MFCNYINVRGYSIKNKFTTKLKLEILYQLNTIDKSAKFLGNYNNVTKNQLCTEKVVGNISYCFGFVKDSRTDRFYLPNTTVKENIKNITDDTCNILAILKKERTDKLYKTITYLKNGIDLNCFLRNDCVADKIDFENIEYSNKEDLNKTKLIEKFKNYLFNEEYFYNINNNEESSDEEEEDEL